MLATGCGGEATADRSDPEAVAREIYRDALLAGASAIFLAHNHPSDDPEPSADDQLTRRFATAGNTIGVELLDHLVVGHDDWTSMARRGVL